MEAKSLGKLLVENLGSAVAASSIVGCNEYYKLELSGAWELPGSSSSRRPNEFKETHSFVPYGN